MKYTKTAVACAIALLVTANASLFGQDASMDETRYYASLGPGLYDMYSIFYAGDFTPYQGGLPFEPWVVSVGAYLEGDWSVELVGMWDGASGEVLVGAMAGLADIRPGVSLFGAAFTEGFTLSAGLFVPVIVNQPFWRDLCYIETKGWYVLPAVSLSWWSTFSEMSGTRFEFGSRLWYVQRGSWIPPETDELRLLAWHYMLPILVNLRFEIVLRIVI
jgi:hypothetical protein